MTSIRQILRRLFFLGLATAAPFVAAHDGEDHGVAPAPAASVGVAAGGQRASAASEAFEVVTVMQAGQVQFFIDRYATNEPVTGAAVTIDGERLRGTAIESAPGLYVLPASGLAPGAHALTLTVEAPGAADLLALSLEIPDTNIAASSSKPGAVPAGIVLVAGLLFGSLAGGVAGYFVRGRRESA